MVAILALIGQSFVQSGRQRFLVPRCACAKRCAVWRSSWGCGIFSPVESVSRCRKPGSMPTIPLPVGSMACGGASMNRQRYQPEARLTMRPHLIGPAGRSWAWNRTLPSPGTYPLASWGLSGSGKGILASLLRCPLSRGFFAQLLVNTVARRYAPCQACLARYDWGYRASCHVGEKIVEAFWGVEDAASGHPVRSCEWPSSRRRSIGTARCEGRSCVRVRRSLSCRWIMLHPFLVFDVLLDHFQWGTTHRGDKVGVRP